MLTHGIVLQCGYISLHCLLHVTGSNQSSSQVDVAVNKIGLQTNGMPIIFKGFLQLSFLLVYIAQVAEKYDLSYYE